VANVIDPNDVTPAAMARVNAYWTEIAGEPVKADILGGSAFVAPCSELAALAA
jgi:hypothetical protein